MKVRPLHVVALYLGLAAQVCFSAAVYSVNGPLAEEDKGTVSIVGKDKIYLNTNQPLQYYIKENFQSEDNSFSSEDNSFSSEDRFQDNSLSNASQSSESSDDSSSEENFEKRTIYKRSLDSKQDLLNTIGDGTNQTSTKQNSDSETLNISESPAGDPESVRQEDSENTKPTEPSLGSETSSESSALKETPNAAIEVTTESRGSESENTADTETTTLAVQVTTEIQSESGSNATEEVEDKSTLLDNEEDVMPQSTTVPTDTELSSTEENKEKSPIEEAIERVNKLSDQIKLVLINYRKEGVVVLPGQSFFPDPMSMQDFKKSFSVGTIDFKNMQVFGLSNFTVEHINTDVDRMQVYILLHMKRLVVLGNYTLRTFFNRAAGPFNVTLLDVDSEGVAEVQTAAEGYLEATDSDMNMFTKEMKVDFKNLGFMGSMFQGAVSTVGDALFDSIKPQILERVNSVIRTDVNKKLREFSVKFINKISPVDLAFSEGRRYVKENGYDPYNIRDHSFILGGLVHVNITQFSVEGLSKFYRVGNLSLSMDAGVIEVGIHVMTHKLTGHCVWSGETFGIIKSGKTNFTVDHLQVRALVTQSLDVRQKPQLKDLDLELGWVKVKMDSAMSLNLMIEGVINAFPRLIRHIIVDTLEEPLREKVQEILNKINVESVVDDNLPRLDSFGL